MASALKKIIICSVILVASAFSTIAQTSYKYSVNLTAVKDDRLTITLQTPKINTATTTFYLPKIVPGTYMYSDYGRFVHNFKALNKTGKELAVKRTSDNSWDITNAKTLTKIVYEVEDTWDTEIKGMVYPMAGTNFEAGKNFVFNTCGIFGYLDKLKDLPFQLNITKPTGFYGSTGLVPIKTSATADTYLCANADHLYDSPIMFSLPDTTSVKVGNTQVLVSVYSPNKLAKSAFIAQHLKEILLATNQYLGGSLPVNKYAFIYYFNGEQKPFGISGAWEHSYSSFYSLNEAPQEQAIGSWVDMSAHEFFHIVTPLTISSKEVKKFDFNNPVLSKHLWLYEGSTEYDAHHVQVQYGINTTAQFLKKLSDKITNSRMGMIDTLSFTELSKESAGKWKEQYGNVYEKGALISASLDLYLLELSAGKYGLANLKHDLGAKYGKDKYFNDDELFDVIAKMTFPEIRTFFTKYVEGGTPIPYDQFFGYAGVKHTPETEISAATVGAFSPGLNQDGFIFIANTNRLNDFGKLMGYKVGDELVSINGDKITTETYAKLMGNFNANAKPGDTLVMVVNRKNVDGVKEAVTLTQPVQFVKKIDYNRLELISNPTPKQLAIRKIWLGQGK
ncbi:peptidase M61 [Pedobacter sp. Du54]|uniref:M61 family metallopeptidase n=1 Tax=Pedobacter anseongensis TaxID=3133439 RepID=UPI0030A3CE03